MSATDIEWTDKTWNPVRGCSMAKGSETGGCLHCYAARFAARDLPGLKSPTTGKAFARILPSGPRWTGDVELIESKLLEPLSWRKPARVFVNSMSDLFHHELLDYDVDRVFATMAMAPQHTFQVLTKRPERMAAYLNRPGKVADIAVEVFKRFTTLRESDRESRKAVKVWPLPNVWIGTSVENQATADERIPLLLQAPAAVRFISAEPLLGPVDLREWLTHDEPFKTDAMLDWCIVGGESGPGARPCDVSWIRSIVAQCQSAGVAAFVKQLGAQPFGAMHRDSETAWRGPVLNLDWKSRVRNRKGGDMAEWAEDLRVREFPVALKHPTN